MKAILMALRNIIIYIILGVVGMIIIGLRPQLGDFAMFANWAVLIILVALWGLLYELILNPVISLWKYMFSEKPATYTKEQVASIAMMSRIEALAREQITQTTQAYLAENARVAQTTQAYLAENARLKAENA